MPKKKQPKKERKPKSKLTKKSFEEDDYTEEEVDGFYGEEDNDTPLDDWNGDWSDAEDDYEDPK